jgi:BirA family biotin operon repressor/biotin-[acetyl-CoA-carboxylase] ligase
VDPAHPASRFRIRHVAETGSTNADVAADAAAGEPEGLVVVADHQTAGRGRLGRTWVAPAGSALLTSILLRPPPAAAHMAVAAVACAAAAACGDRPGIKWPNDLVADDGRKLAGILAEASVAEHMTAVTVGLGLNLWLPPEFPEELRSTACGLDALGGPIPSRDEMLAAVLTELEPRYAHLLATGPGALLEEYRARCVTIGALVRVEQHDRTWDGRAIDVDESFALLVEDGAAGVATVQVGDVIHLRVR